MSVEATMKPELKHLVFAYGTLKRGEPNFKWLTKEAVGSFQVLAVGKTVQKRALVIGSRYNVPYLLDHSDDSTCHHVVGEILSVDDQMLESLDVFEDAPKYYTKVVETILVTEAIADDERVKVGAEVDCFAYMLQNFKPELLTFPFYENYSSSGDHGKSYSYKEGREENVNYYPDVKLA